MIQFSCPSCKTVLQYATPGTMIACPKCKTQMRVPAVPTSVPNTQTPILPVPPTKANTGSAKVSPSTLMTPAAFNPSVMPAAKPTERKPLAATVQIKSKKLWAKFSALPTHLRYGLLGGVGGLILFSCMCCGCLGLFSGKGGSGKQSESIAKADAIKVSASDEAPPGSWQTVKGSQDGKTYSLQLPPGWKWDPDGMADKSLSFTCTFLFEVKNIQKVYVKKTSEAYAKGMLDLVRIQLKEHREKGRLRDLRIIKVGDEDAVWVVIAASPGDGAPTSVLKTQCFLQTAGCTVELDCQRLDGRRDRKESEFEESQSEFLKITQSFRIISVKNGKDK
jgi:hypothetical protein